MAHERMKAALDRIDRALERLEQAEIPQETDDVGTSDAARRRAAEALQSLDTLITELKASRG
jgi:hypothetical protein